MRLLMGIWPQHESAVWSQCPKVSHLDFSGPPLLVLVVAFLGIRGRRGTSTETCECQTVIFLNMQPMADVL